jgi:hypothetical protein
VYFYPVSSVALPVAFVDIVRAPIFPFPDSFASFPPFHVCDAVRDSIRRIRLHVSKQGIDAKGATINQLTLRRRETLLSTSLPYS